MKRIGQDFPSFTKIFKEKSRIWDEVHKDVPQKAPCCCDTYTCSCPWLQPTDSRKIVDYR